MPLGGIVGGLVKLDDVMQLEDDMRAVAGKYDRLVCRLGRIDRRHAHFLRHFEKPHCLGITIAVGANTLDGCR